MAARKIWIVMQDDQNMIQSDNDWGDKYIPRERSRDILSIFFRLRDADSYASQMAIQYPGKDFHVLKQSHGYISQPRPVESKFWTEDGQFIPKTTTL